MIDVIIFSRHPGEHHRDDGAGVPGHDLGQDLPDRLINLVCMYVYIYIYTTIIYIYIYLYIHHIKL